MGLLDIVNEEDLVVGREDFIKVHCEGLRHRSVQLLLFKYPGYQINNELLLAQRSKRQETSSMLFHPSAGGHVRSRQTYIEAALNQLRDELFNEIGSLPTGISFKEICRYKNDTRPTNRENTRLYVASYPGPFFPDPKEIECVFWKKTVDVSLDMASNADGYTQSFINAMRNYMKWQK